MVWEQKGLREKAESGTASSLAQSGICLPLNVSVCHTHACVPYLSTHDKCLLAHEHAQSWLIHSNTLMFHTNNKASQMHTCTASYTFKHFFGDHRAPQVGRRKKNQVGENFCQHWAQNVHMVWSSCTTTQACTHTNTLTDWVDAASICTHF